MTNIKILDCTLRDGGYVNLWNFGLDNIKKILNNLASSNIDIIECGFLKNDKVYGDNFSIFNIEQLKNHDLLRHSSYVAMINFGEYQLEDIPPKQNSNLDGIRVAFHKKDLDSALVLCKGIIDKGYQVFVQPMVSINYSNEEFLDLIKRVNVIQPYAFYIVDSFGNINMTDLLRLYSIVKNTLSCTIKAGYHAHNNLQLAFANTQLLIEQERKHDLIIDTSVFGMGRGAGNLNTELFTEYLNNKFGLRYLIEPILYIMDEVVYNIYKEIGWGYSMPQYLSAKRNCHPNYANHLSGKETLKVDHINTILKSVADEKKNSFDKQYIESLYLDFQTRNSIMDENSVLKLKQQLENKSIVLLASGPNAVTEKNKVIKYYKQANTIFIAVNFLPEILSPDFIFYSNLKRFDKSDNINYEKLILTSNMINDIKNDAKHVVNYSSLLNCHDFLVDNGGLMLINLLILLNVKEVLLAGFDGYINSNHNCTKFANDAEVINKSMREEIQRLSKLINIKFITETRYQ